MAVGKYVKNLGKSIGLAGIDVMKDLNPVITDTVQSNKEFVSEHYGKVKEFIQSDDGLKSSEYYKSSKKLLKNALHELKTGEIYTKESQKRMMNDMAEVFGIDMKAFDLDFSDLDDDEGGSSSKTTTDTESFFDSSSDTDTSKDGTQVDISNNTTKTLNRMTTNNIVMSNSGGKATNKILSSSSKAMLQANMQSTSALLQGIHTISTFQNENTVKFYNDVSDKLAEIGNSLSNLSNMFGGGSKDQDIPMYTNDLEDLMMNGLKLDFYKRRLQNSTSNGSDAGEIFGLLKEYGLPMLQGIASNPIGELMKLGMKSILPRSFKNSMGRLNDSIQSLPISLQFLFNKWKGGTGIKKTIGELFGIDLGKSPKLDFGRYNKGAIAFDGVTKKAITNVIPSLLAKILSAVSNNPLHQEELVYDYDKGKFTTKTAIKDHMKGRLEQEAINDNLGEYKAKVLSQFKKSDLTEAVQTEINNAFRKITEQALTPDSSLAMGTLSNDLRVETAIRQMYKGLSNTGHREFQKGVVNSISSRNNIYNDLIKNESYHNAYDIDTNMINEVMKAKKELSLESQLKKLGLNVNKNGVLGRIFDFDDMDTNENISGMFAPLTKFINKMTDKLDDAVYGDNEKGITQKGRKLDTSDSNLFNDDSTATAVRGSKGKGRRINIQTGIVNVYANKFGKGFTGDVDGSHADGLKRVPKDGYVAELHEGERVLTEEEAKAYNKKENLLKSKMEDIKAQVMVEKEKDGTTTMVLSGQKVVDMIRDKLITPVKDFINDKIFQPIGDFFTKKVIEPFKAMAKKGKNYFMEVIFNPIKEAFEPMKQRMKTWFSDKKSKLFEWGRNTFLGGKTWKETLEGFKTKADGKIRSGVGKVTGAMTNGFNVDGMKDSVKSTATSVKDTIVDGSNKAKDKAEEMLAKAKTKANETAETVKTKYQKTKDKISNKNKKKGKNKGKSDVDSVVSLTSDMENRIVKIDKNVEIIKDTLIDFYNAYLTAQGVQDTDMPNKRAGGGRFARIKNFLRDKFDKFKNFFSNPLKGIKDKFKGFTKIFKGPMKFFKNLANIPKKLGKMVKNTLSTVSKITKKLTGFVQEQIPKIIDGVKKTATKMFEGAKNFMKSVGKGLKGIIDGAMAGVKTLYGDLKAVGKELWGTAKSAVSTVWDRFFGDGSKGKNKKSKSMEVIIKGGHLDGIREVVHVTLKKKTDSYASTKAKMLAEDEEDAKEREGNESVGDEGREGNKSRIEAYRERLSKWMGDGFNWVKEKIKNSFIGKKFEQGKEWIAGKYQRGKQALGQRLMNNQGKGMFGKASRAVGKLLSGPQTPASVESQGMTPTWIIGSNIDMSGGNNTEGIAEGISNALSGGKNGKGGLVGRLMSKFMDSKLGGKFFNTKFGSKALDLATNGKGVLGNIASLGGKAGGALGKLGPMLGGLSKFAGPIGLALTAGKGVFDGFKGWKNAGQTFGTDDATFGQKLSSAGGSILNGLSFGLLDSEKSSKFLHKAGTFATNLIPGVGMYRWGKKKLEENKEKKRVKAIQDKQARERAKQKLEEERSLINVETKGGTGQSKLNSIINGSSAKATAEPNIDKNGVESISEKSNIGGGIIPFVSPVLFKGRNLITAFRHNKKKEEEAEKKLLQQMSPEERESYLASKSNSSILKGGLNALGPIGGLLGKLFGGSSKKGGIFSSVGKSFKKFGNSVLGLLGISAAGGVDKVSSSGGFKGFWQKMKNGITGKGWKTDEELKNESSGGGSSGGSGGGTPISIKNIGDIWKLSAKYEVGYNGNDSLASGKISNTSGDYGGKSYGIPQFSLNMGSLKSFVNSLKTRKPEWYARLSKYPLGSSGFDSEWKAIAQAEGTEFANIQNEAIKDTHYGSFVNNNKGLFDITKRSNALQSAMWSTAVQFGGGSSVLKRALEGKNPSSMSDEEITRALYAEKRANNGAKWFSGCSSSVQQAVVNRFHREEADVIGLIKQEGDSQQASGDSKSKARSVAEPAMAKANPTPKSTLTKSVDSPMTRMLSNNRSSTKSYSNLKSNLYSMPLKTNGPTTTGDRSISNTSKSAVTSSYKLQSDEERMVRYSEMVDILNNISKNTGATAQLLDKMFTLIDKKFKKDEERHTEAVNQQNATRNNPFITGVDPDIEIIATGV